MRRHITIGTAIAAFLIAASTSSGGHPPDHSTEFTADEAGDKVAQKTARMGGTPARILAHYMPWFMAKPFSPTWGWHWTMGTFNPEGGQGGRLTIASHYHPIIGPYDSGDPDVLEYHALLMKLAGIDGIVIDWYGTVDFQDYALNHRNCALFVDQVAKTGLEFAVCYEDQTILRLVKGGRLLTSQRLEHARREIGWIRENWFGKPAYLKINGQPVLLSFGQDGLSDSEWDEVAGGRAAAFVYLSEHSRRKAAAGAFDWPSPRVGSVAQDEFYKKACEWPVGMAVAYPRFHDIYEDAKIHPSWGRIDDAGGKTFAITLEVLWSGLPLIQISTWNDWGEGTMVEPSTEFGYRDLEVVQRMRRRIIDPGFENRPEDLRLPLRLYKLRKGRNDQRRLSQELDQVSRLLSKGSIEACASVPRFDGRAKASSTMTRVRRRPHTKPIPASPADTKLDCRQTIPEAVLMNTEPIANESADGPSEPAPAASPSALRAVHTPNFPELLRRLRASLLVTTYQAGKLVIVRDEGDHLNTHFRAFQAPMGLALQGDRLAIGTSMQVWEFVDVPAVTAKLEPYGRHDACFLPRSCHITGNVQIHEMAWGSGQELWFVNTRFSCLCTFDRSASFTPRWRPPFVTALEPTDRCHLNGLAMVDGRPRYVTALGQTDAPAGWRPEKASGGILMDVESGEVLARGLSMPHSPRWYAGRLWVCESGVGTLGFIDPKTGRYEAVAATPGFTRGLDFAGDLAFVGLSQVRESAVFSGIPITERLAAHERTCGVCVIDLVRGEAIALLRFEEGVQEVFAVQLLPGRRYPEMINDDAKLLENSFVVPDAALADVPAILRGCRRWPLILFAWM